MGRIGVVAVVYAALYVSLVGGNGLRPEEVASGIFWPAVAVAIYWRKSGRNRWVSFGIGLLVGLCALLVLAVAAGVARGGAA